jgi:small GTP-binding protein
MTSKTILFLGDAGVGKTSCIKRIINKKINSKYINTERLTIYSTENENIQIYDYPGQVKFNIQKSNLPEEVSICIIMYDVTNKMSYDSIPFWKNVIESNYSNKKPLVFVVGNKVDSKQYRKVNDLTTINISVKKNKNIEPIKTLIYN